MENEVKNNYLLGIIGALIGAFIGAIPWILMYIFGNMMYAIITILIVICSFYGYKITKAKIDKKLPIILSTASFISITVTMFIIIPICMMIQNGVEVNIETFKFVYSYDQFLTAIVGDYIISLLFCIVVIGGIIVNLNKQIKNGVESKDIKIIAKDAGNEEFSKEDIEIVRNAFEKNECMNKNHTITKELILEELERTFEEEKARRIFDYLKIQQIIKKKSGKYYFSDKAQKSTLYRYGITGIRTFVIVMIIAITLAGIIIFTEEKNNSNTNNNLVANNENNTEENRIYDLGVNNLKLEVPEDMHILSAEEITYYFAPEYANMYDCLAASSDFNKIIMVFSKEKADKSAKEYLKESIDDDDVEIKEEKIKDNTFYTAEFTYEENDTRYISIYCVYDAGDKFICMILDSLESDQISLKDVIK